MRRPFLLLLVITVGLAGGAALVYLRPWDPHLSAEETERAVLKLYRAGAVRSVDCRWSQNNSGPYEGEVDVDYACKVEFRDGSTTRGWVGTNDKRITRQWFEL